MKTRIASMAGACAVALAFAVPGSFALADSGRKWGWNETHAWSGWYAARKDSGWPSARTYYGR